MSVKELDWGLSERGLTDAARHRRKTREAIQKNIAEIISDTSIITRRRGQIVRVPVRGLKSYRFIFRRDSEGGIGAGQGEGEAGDVVGRQPAEDGAAPGQAGETPGIDYLETEIDLEELIDMMLQDLGLPNLRQKQRTETEAPQGWKFESIEKTGLTAHLDKKRTVREALKRRASFVAELMRRTGQPEEACLRALGAARGDLLRAEKLLREGATPEGGGHVSVHLFQEDLRYRVLDEDVEVHSHAVVLAMMDVSGSMGLTKKYLARSFFFWLLEFLRQIYRTVEIRFIAHTTEARLVDEETFFHKGESGGTFCHSAYDLAGRLMETAYPPQKWNVYAFHFSDGEDFEPDRTLVSARRIMQAGASMVGYAEVRTDPYGASFLMTAFENHLQLRRTLDARGFTAFTSMDPSLPFLGVVLRDKSHVYLALKEFLRRDRSFAA